MNRSCVIIGGTFNPVTVAHLRLGEEAKRLLPEADIYYVPSNMSFMKDWKKIDDNALFWSESRMDFLKLVLDEKKNFYVSDIELTGKVDGRSYNTVQYFLKEYDEVYWGMGADKLNELERWYKAEDLMLACKFLLFNRDDIVIDFQTSDFLKKYKSRFTEIKISIADNISSSAVRAAYESGNIRGVEYMLDARLYMRLSEGLITRKS